VTFLFTDVEGSTKLLHDLGAEGYSRALAAHRRILREAFTANGGVEVDTQGDAFFVAFPTAPGALAAAGKALAGLESGPIRVRVGIHSGRRTWARRATSGSTCTGLRALLPVARADRCSSRRRPLLRVRR
jgi:class 3 adenylate cyclase